MIRTGVFLSWLLALGLLPSFCESPDEEVQGFSNPALCLGDRDETRYLVGIHEALISTRCVPSVSQGILFVALVVVGYIAPF